MPETKSTLVLVEPKFLSRQTAAAFLSLSQSTFEKMVSRGELPQPRKLAKGRVGWLLDELKAWGSNLPTSDITPPENSD